MKNVLVVFHDCHKHTGASASMLDLIAGLKQKPLIKLSAIVPNEDGLLIHELDRIGIPWASFSYGSSRFSVAHGLKRSISTFLRAWGRFFMSIFSLLRARRTLKEIDVVYSNTTDITFGLLLGYFFNKKHVCHVREFGYLDQSARQMVGDRLFYKLMYKYSDLVVTISDALRLFILEQVDDYQNKVIRLYDDLTLTNGNDTVKNFEKNNKFLMVGTLVPQKGQEFIIRVVSKLRDAGVELNLGLAGQGNEKNTKHLKRLISELNLGSQVELLGQIEHVWAIREQYMGVFVASRSEAFGRVTIEALRAGQIVLASNSGANSELIDHSENGFLYELDDLNSCVLMVQKIMTMEERELAKISSRARASSQFYYQFQSANTIAENILTRL